ncbi:MAG TPA: hypothetical protein VFD92_18435 [Candidatus Binatia bacterium]|nr:hypothetical protein [Candidatus Binatia bacterium]
MTKFLGFVACAALVLGVAGVVRGEDTAPPPGSAAPGKVEIVIEPSESDAGPGQADSEGKKAGAAKADEKPTKLAAKKGAVESSGEKFEHIKATFDDFCKSWVDKLRERERYNITKIKWETAPDGAVVGEYVGYDTNNVGPQTVGNVDTTPIGKLVYLELRLRRTGKSKEEALAHDPEIVERTEVTEIFRFERGAWVY